MQIKQSTLTTIYQPPKGFRCFSFGIRWLFRCCPVFLHYKQHGIDHTGTCLPGNLQVILQDKDQEVKLLGGRQCVFTRFFRYSKLSSKKRLFQFISSPTVRKVYTFCYSSGKPAVINLLTFCANLLCEKCLAIILVCFSLIASEAVHLFTSFNTGSLSFFCELPSHIFVYFYWGLFVFVLLIYRTSLHIPHLLFVTCAAGISSQYIISFIFSLWSLLPFKSLMYPNLFSFPFLLLHLVP